MTDVKIIKKRKNFGYLLNNLNLLEAGVEVGVFSGDFSEQILKRWKGGPLYLIDIWQHLPNYFDSCNLTDEEMDHLYKKVRIRMKKWGNRVHIIRSYSNLAAQTFSDGSLDFVYLDANHAFASVKEDIELWYPKLRSGGLLAGHDYYNAKVSRDGEPIIKKNLRKTCLTSFGVKRAVDEFIKEYKLNLYQTVERWPTWLVLKP